MDQSGFKALAQFSDERATVAPDLPTAKEQGFDIIMSSARGLAMGCEVPEEIRTKFSEAVAKALDNPAFQAQAKQQSLALSYRSVTNFAGADFSTFADTVSPDQATASDFQTRLRGIVNRAQS